MYRIQQDIRKFKIWGSYSGVDKDNYFGNITDVSRDHSVYIFRITGSVQEAGCRFVYVLMQCDASL